MSLMEKIDTPIGSYAPDFELPGVDGQVHHLARYLEQWKAVGVVFICNHCSYVWSYLDRLKQIQIQFQSRECTLIGINANDATRYPEESFPNMKKFALEKSLNFPYLWDPTQDVAHSFGAQKTPEAFLINAQGIVCYRGRIDDSTEEPQATQINYLQNAIASLLAGEDVSPKLTEAIGRSIQWRN